MPVKVKIEQVDRREFTLAFDELLSPQERARLFAEGAQEILDETDNTNRNVLGRVPKNRTWVDGREGAAVATVKAEGVVIREYDLVIDVLLYIADMLRTQSPLGKGGDKRPGHPGFYKASHTLFADTVEVRYGAEIPEANEYVFMSDAPYSRRVEKRHTIYEMVAAKAKQRFGNIARVQFTYRGLVAGMALAKSGPVARKRETGRWRGRFANMGGPRAQNVASVRFPSIVVTLGR